MQVKNNGSKWQKGAKNNMNQQKISKQKDININQNISRLQKDKEIVEDNSKVKKKHKSRKQFIKMSRKTYRNTKTKNRINKNSPKIVRYKSQEYRLIMINNLINQQILSSNDDNFIQHFISICQNILMLNQEQTIYEVTCKLQQRILSPINPDCIKVNPLDENLFAFAYYQQHPSFVGGIAVYNHQKTKSVSKIQISDYGPVMHICWLTQKHKDGRYILCGVSRCQKCFIALYDSQDNKIQIVKDIFLEQEGAEQIFCLYIDAQIINDKLRLFVSSNQSKVYQLILSHDKFIQIERFVYNKHQYAVWACRANKNHMACGDEVNKLYLYQIEQQKLLSTNNKIHQQGICDIVFLNENVFYSGGFDGKVGLADLRNFATGKTQWNYGGTIWRILPSQESNQKLLLCNSSEKKFMIIDIRTNKILWNSENSHQSLAYAADWNKNTLLTASFYDKVVCRWHID